MTLFDYIDTSTTKTISIAQDTEYRQLIFCPQDKQTINLHFTLTQKKIKADIYVVVIGVGKTQVNITCEHQDDKTVSSTHIVILGTKNSHTSLNGSLCIQSNVQGADGYLLEENIFFSPHAQIRALPILDIQGSDNEGEHGASVQHISQKNFLYLKSRGIDNATAQQMFLTAYLDTLGENILAPSLKGDIMSKFTL